MFGILVCAYRNGKYTGTKKVLTPPRATGKKHTIDAWSLIQDTEGDMLQANGRQALFVSVPCYSALVEFAMKGGEKCLFDLVEAERSHDRTLYPEICGDSEDPISHTMLLVAHGTFVPHQNSGIEHEIHYWILKNQWKKIWGCLGFIYLIRNSSLALIHKAKRKNRYSPDVFRLFCPAYAFVKQREPPGRILYSRAPKELLHYVHSSKHQNTILMFLFYDSKLCNLQSSGIAEVLNDVDKAYEFDINVMATIDVDAHPSAISIFQLGRCFESRKPLFMVFRPQSCRTVSNAGIFPQAKILNLGNLLKWLGDSMDMSPGKM